MDQTIEILRVSIRSFRINICAENFRVVTGLCSGTSFETCFSPASQPQYEQLFCICPGSAVAFQKTSLRIRSHCYHKGLCYKETSWTHEGSERRTKVFVPLQGDVRSQASKLRRVSASSLYAWCHSHYQRSGVRRWYSCLRSGYLFSFTVCPAGLASTIHFALLR